MVSPNPLNVFKGPNSLSSFFDPDQNPPLPLVEIPDALNPLRLDGVRIFAKMLTQLPAQNVKSLPALRMLRNEKDGHRQKIVEASSGSTVLSLGMISRALWGNEDVHAYVTNKKHPDSLKLLRFFGLNVNLYGGLAQQEPYDPNGIMSRLKHLADMDPGVCYPGQYHNDHNWKAHEQWTGAQIWKQLPEINVFSSTIGTGGCAVGTGTYLKSKNPALKVVGVCNAYGDPTPGPRHFPNFESSPFPWRETIDVFEDVASVDSYRTSMKLSRYGIIAGPSSGEALHGLITYLRRIKSEGRLTELADPSTGEVSCAFVCADLPYQYMDMYYKKLADEEFPPVQNEILLHCDQDAYDERWFWQPSEAANHLFSNNNILDNAICSANLPCLCLMQSLFSASTPSSTTSDITDASSSSSLNSGSSIFSLPEYPTTANQLYVSSDMAILDLRPRDAFVVSHLRGSVNIPLSLTGGGLFSDATAVEGRWVEMKQAFEREDWTLAGGRKVLVLCEDEDSGRMATAMLRAKDIQATCVAGGYLALATDVGVSGVCER